MTCLLKNAKNYRRAICDKKKGQCCVGSVLVKWYTETVEIFIWDWTTDVMFQAEHFIRVKYDEIKVVNCREIFFFGTGILTTFKTDHLCDEMK